MNSKYFIGLLALSCLSSANGDVLGQFTFDNRTSLEAALQPSLPATGVILSSLAFNTTTALDFAGLNKVPSTANDGYGFGNSPGSLFFHRAESGNPSAWGPAVATAATTAPLNFTVAADATHDVTLTGVTFAVGNGTATIYNFQRVGDPRGPEITSSVGGTVALTAPIVIPAGTASTFTVSLNSGNFNTSHVFDSITLEGSVATLATNPVASYTFNDTGSGTEAERMPVALGASNVASGLTVTPLSINASFDFAGFNSVPDTVNDGFGFGSANVGTIQPVMFIHRAAYFNNSAVPDPRPTEGSVTTWGNPANTPGVSTTVGNSPLSFTITADSLTTLTLNSVTIAAGAGNAFIVYFQEAGAVSGSSSSPGGNTSETASLTNPVVIGPSQSKTFTINLNSGNLNTAHAFNTISVNGSISTAGNTYTTWAAANAGNQSADLDFDNDGTENGIEFFMGETGSGFTARPVPVNGVITWSRDPNATVTSFKVQTSETLADGEWTDVVPPDANLDLSDATEVRYTLPTGTPRKFARLVVTP